MICVLMVAAGADWESAAVTALSETSDVVLLKRCVDVDDLLAAAAAGQAQVAVVAAEAPGVDRSAVEHLRRHGVRAVVVLPDRGDDQARSRLAAIGVRDVLPVHRVPELPDRCRRAAEPEDDPTPEAPVSGPDAVSGPVTDARGGPGPGRVVVVWGPSGAPGRTTLAVALAAEIAARGERVTLVDADPWGGGVAQHLGILDQASGLLSATRLATAGTLTDGFPRTVREAATDLWVLTGLPRPDRWVEVRPGLLEEVIATAATHGHVVVDTGFCLEEDQAADFSGRPGRNDLTLGALQVADDLLVVGTADPVGLARLARGLVDLTEVTATSPRVVLNRFRPSVGWSAEEVTGMVQGFARLAGVHVLPQDQTATDRALVSGRALREVGDSPLVRAVAGLVDVLLPATATGGRRTLRRRTAGRARRR